MVSSCVVCGSGVPVIFSNASSKVDVSVMLSPIFLPYSMRSVVLLFSLYFLVPWGMSTVLILLCDAASILYFIPPTGPMIPPEFMVPVMVMVGLRVVCLRSVAVSMVAAAPALGPPTSPGADFIV